MQLLREHIQQYIAIPEDDWAMIESVLVEIDLNKNQILSYQNKIEHGIYFVIDGVFRFFIEQENKDITFDFAFGNEFISAYTSFLTQTKSDCQIQAITNAKVLHLSRTHLNLVYQKTKWGDTLSRIIAEELFMRKSKRETELLTLTAEERYQQLFTQHPKLIQEIPQKYLASYIGITPQALSRIRKRIN